MKEIIIGERGQKENMTTKKYCDDCETLVYHKNLVCPHCLTSLGDTQLPLDELVKKTERKMDRKEQDKYEFRSKFWQENKHKIERK